MVNVRHLCGLLWVGVQKALADQVQVKSVIYKWFASEALELLVRFLVALRLEYTGLLTLLVQTAVQIVLKAFPLLPRPQQLACGVARVLVKSVLVKFPLILCRPLGQVKDFNIVSQRVFCNLRHSVGVYNTTP